MLMKHRRSTSIKYLASLLAKPLGCRRIARSVIECPTCSCNSADILNFSHQISKIFFSLSAFCFSFLVNAADISSLLLMSLVVDYSPPPAQSSATPTSLFPPRSSRFFHPFPFLAFSLRIPRSSLISCRLPVFICSGELFQNHSK